jgi:hypothetical protein
MIKTTLPESRLVIGEDAFNAIVPQWGLSMHFAFFMFGPCTIKRLLRRMNGWALQGCAVCTSKAVQVGLTIKTKGSSNLFRPPVVREETGEGTLRDRAAVLSIRPILTAARRALVTGMGVL